MIDPRSILARLAAAFVALVLVGFVSAQGLELTFEKAAVGDTVWTGAVSGDVEGTLTTVLIHADDAQPVWQVDFYWIITADDPARSFIARLDGTLDTETGEVALSGSVVDGYRAGARVEEQARLVDGERSEFHGTIVVFEGAVSGSTPLDRRIRLILE
jgi:hypothetical protein